MTRGETWRQTLAFESYRSVNWLARSLPEREGRRLFTVAGRLAFHVLALTLVAWAVVCLTASANLRERDALTEAGAVACLSKDEGLDAIVAAIRDAARAAV